MAHAKTAAPCEYCGTRVRHGTEGRGSFTVGVTVKGINRLVHWACKQAWYAIREDRMMRWRELDPDVFLALEPRLQRLIMKRLRTEKFRSAAVQRRIASLQLILDEQACTDA